MTAIAAGITDDFVDRLKQRAPEAEELRRLPADTVKELQESGLFDLLKPARYGGQQADFKAILDPVRRLAHGCTSTAWTAGFFTLHNWMLALFGEQAQDDGVRVPTVPRVVAPGAHRSRHARPTAASGSPDAGPGPPV